MTRWNNMREQVEEYLDVRRRLGYQLKIPGKELLCFARFADMHESHKILTIDLAVELTFRPCRHILPDFLKKIQ